MVTGYEASTEERTLDRWARAVSGAIAGITVLVTCYYILGARTVLVPAPECASISECTVKVSAPVDGVVVAALLVLAALFALMALTGLVWAPKFGDGTGIEPVTKASETKHIPQGVESSRVKPQLNASGGSTPGAKVEEALKLWNSLPKDMQDAAAEFGGEEWGVTREKLQQSIVEVAHEPGRGSKPYYAKFRLEGADRVVKLTKGGRGKTGVTSRHDDR